MTCSEGESEVRTSVPRAFSRMCSMSSLTTLKLTSASSRAMRISLSASPMFSSVRVPCPRRFLKARWSLSVRFSNMIGIQIDGRGGAVSPRNIRISRYPGWRCWPLRGLSNDWRRTMRVACKGVLRLRSSPRRLASAQDDRSERSVSGLDRFWNHDREQLVRQISVGGAEDFGCGDHGVGVDGDGILDRSKERRVGKECRSRWAPYHCKK